ncbi:von Willebrand factor A domain-containing protein 7-like [Polymixia lowei]
MDYPSKTHLASNGDCVGSHMGLTVFLVMYLKKIPRLLGQRTSPPKGRLHSLSALEKEVMKKYIESSLAAGIIHPSSAPAGAGFFFMDKRDKTLRPCIDYRGLNDITIKNRSTRVHPMFHVARVKPVREESSKRFHYAINFVKQRNRRVDIRNSNDPEFHFDLETFEEGRKVITDGISVIKAVNKLRRFQLSVANSKLGQLLHPLQDFYSHSNWVELGNELPNSNLIRSDTSIGNIADKNRATCRNCVEDDCTNNILEDILQEKILTTGYFGLVPFFSTKPPGKCSHGNFPDMTRNIEPIGGINKDTKTSSHGHLHVKAANLAIAATIEVLEDIHRAAGNTDFLRMMWISKGSNKALCFVIDTTGSMSDDIAAVKRVTSLIVSSTVGTKDEPSVYILVPFSDPDFGPLIRTTDPDVFKSKINALSADGGGDRPEMSLSGLQLALTGAPPGSEIFLFTDAPAKDSRLRSTVIALIERKKAVVNFMLTNILGLRRRRQSGDGQQLSRMTSSDVELYRDLARTSGGQAIQVTKSQLSEATSIITQSSSSSLVTLLQAVRNPGRADNFTFLVDESVRNLTIYVTGSSLNFTLISPSGVSQSSDNMAGSLATIQSVGNFQTLRLNKQVGLWEIRVVSTGSYTVKVIGQSAIDFLFDFVEFVQGPFTQFDVLESRPRAGVNGSLVVSVTGSDSATVTEVTLVETSGSGEVTGSVESLGGGDFLVQVDRIPSEEFVVRVKGQETSKTRASPANFQRQSSTNLRASNLTVMADSDSSVLEPGTPFSVPFTVMTNGTGGNFTIRATNDRGFNSTFPSSLFLVTGVSTNGTVNLTAPLNTTSGSDVTLTIEAEAPGAADTNYVVLQFSIMTRVTDIVRPVCQVISVAAHCSKNCSEFTWELTANFTDGNGTGIERISLQQGNGTFNTSTVVGIDGENVTLVSYVASCCSTDVELVAVDEVGNVGACFKTISRGNPLKLCSYFYLTVWALVMFGPLTTA